MTVQELKAKTAEEVDKLELSLGQIIKLAGQAEGLFAVEQLLSIMAQCTVAQDKVEQENERDVLAQIAQQPMDTSAKAMFEQMKGLILDVNQRHAAIIKDRNFRFATLKQQYETELQ